MIPFAQTVTWDVLAQGLTLLATFVFFGLHLVHLKADFPNFSRWSDWSKYTDEGWYGDAAIRLYQLGHWYVPGDFNPAAALPVWPFLEAILFRFTGVSLVAVRALTVCVFGGILLASWWLIVRAERTARPGPGGWLAGSVATLLLVTNPFCFVFTRLAILEPLLILLTLLALLCAQQVRADPYAAVAALLRRNAAPILVLGTLLPLMVLTKTTGLFLVPAVAWMLFAAAGYRFRTFLVVGAPAALLGLLLWLAYFLLLIRPHYLLDYRYLFSANAYTGMTRANCVSVLIDTIKDGKWFGVPLYAASVASLLVCALSFRRLRQYPLIPALVLWAFGYAAFLAYHNNLQPRYYLVVAVPLTLLAPVVFRDLVLPRVRGAVAARRAGLFAAIALAGIAGPDAAETVSFVLHPQYTFVTMAHQVQQYIAQDQREHPNHSSLVLSISGSDLSLITGLHSICDDFGTAELADRVDLYQPGWYAAWNLIEDDKMDALTPAFRVRRVATFPAMDDPDRNLLVLYRLDPLAETAPASPSHLAAGARSHVGQEPSRTQASH